MLMAPSDIMSPFSVFSVQFADGVILLLLIGQLEGFFIPLHEFNLTPVNSSEMVQYRFSVAPLTLKQEKPSKGLRAQHNTQHRHHLHQPALRMLTHNAGLVCTEFIKHQLLKRKLLRRKITSKTIIKFNVTLYFDTFYMHCLDHNELFFSLIICAAPFPTAAKIGDELWLNLI